MAALTPSGLQKRKRLATYGRKAGAYDRGTNLHFFEEDELARSLDHITAPSRLQDKRPRNTRAETGTRKDASPTRPVGALPRRSNTQKTESNAFDVPSSDDELTVELSDKPVLPKVKFERKLVDDRKRKRMPQVSSEAPGPRNGQAHRLVTGPAVILDSKSVKSSTEHKAPVTPQKQRAHLQDSPSLTCTPHESGKMSVRERLRFRRKATGIEPMSVIETSHVAPKFMSPPSHESRGSSDRKRPERLSSDARARTTASALSDGFTISPVHYHGEIDESHINGPLNRPRTPEARPLHSSQEPITPVTPNHSTPRTSTKVATLTPKQSQLWSQLLTEEPMQHTPRAIPMESLRLSDKTHTDRAQGEGIRAPKERQISNSRHKRTRLVDSLKATASASVSASDSEHEGEDDVEVSDESQSVIIDTEMSDRISTEMSNAAQTAQATPSSQVIQHSTSNVENGTRRTYAQQRSHLADDSLEDSLFASLPLDIPPRAPAATRRTGNSGLGHKSSAFDVEDSDGEENAGKIRSIHELRAAGKSSRITAHIEDMLQDLSDHSPTSRSRRRGAALELAKTLLDKFYATQFLQNNFETRLLAETHAFADPIADFLLATAILLLSALELSGGALQSMKQAVPWLVKMLDKTIDIEKVAKDRKNNLSRSTQSDLLALVEKLKPLESVWSQQMPSAIQARTVSLKAMEILVGKLRRGGDQTLLLDQETLLHMVSAGSFGADEESFLDKSLDSSMVISILESLSTSPSTASWPSTVLERVAALPAVFGETWNAPQHTQFLAYRLCLNITNDSAFDHAIFARNGSVTHLLRRTLEGFEELDKLSNTDTDLQHRTVRLDLLLLAIGNLINLAEHSTVARRETATPTSSPTLTSLAHIFRKGHERALEAESEEESTSNVAYGYLSVMLANLCQDEQVRKLVAVQLPGGSLASLAEAVQEFVAHHEKVDLIDFEGVEGQEVWSSFTARLKDVLARLKAVM